VCRRGGGGGEGGRGGGDGEIITREGERGMSYCICRYEKNITGIKQKTLGQLGAHAALCDVYVYIPYIHYYVILQLHRYGKCGPTSSSCRAV